MARLGNEKTVVVLRGHRFIIWQLGPLWHNNKVLHENTHYIFCHTSKVNILTNVSTNKHFFFSWNPCELEVINNLLMLALQLATYILLSFSNMAYNFMSCFNSFLIIFLVWHKIILKINVKSFEMIGTFYQN